MAFRFDVRVRCSVCSFSDPPEEISYEVALSRVNWNFLFLEAKHGRLHNLSRADTGSYKGFGNYYTGLTIGFYLWRENNKK